MANNQNLHPSKVCNADCLVRSLFKSQCSSSNTGQFGSKFVSIVVLGTRVRLSVQRLFDSCLDDENGMPHLKGFQMSNEFCQMIHEEIIKVSRKDCNTFVVLKSKRRYVTSFLSYSFPVPNSCIRKYCFSILSKIRPRRRKKWSRGVPSPIYMKISLLISL